MPIVATLYFQLDSQSTGSSVKIDWSLMSKTFYKQVVIYGKMQDARKKTCLLQIANRQ